MKEMGRKRRIMYLVLMMSGLLVFSISIYATVDTIENGVMGLKIPK